MYAKALNELIDFGSNLFSYSASSFRIRMWWNLIGDYIDNDTNEHNILADPPYYGDYAYRIPFGRKFIQLLF